PAVRRAAQELSGPARRVRRARGHVRQAALPRREGRFLGPLLVLVELRLDPGRDRPDLPGGEDAVGEKPALVDRDGIARPPFFEGRLPGVTRIVALRVTGQ